MCDADATADPDDLDLALRLCDVADGVTMAAFRRADLTIDTKPDLTPVTEADRETERAVRDVVARTRPDDGVYGEEFGASRSGDAGRRWIIDPIDGTMNYVRGIPVWATLLALEVDGRFLVGAVSAPALGRRWWAGRGLGACAGGPDGGRTSIHVSKIDRLDDAHLSGSGLSDWVPRGGPAAAVALALRCWRDRSFGDFWSHMLVAEGACDIALDPVVSLWDIAAVQVIVEEAGGRFTDLAGIAHAEGGSAVSTNGILHDTVLACLCADSDIAPGARP